MTTLSVETLLAALMLLAGDNRQVREEAVRGAVVESGAAQPAAKERTDTRPGEEPERQADQRPGMASDQSVINPFAPAGEPGAVRVPFSQGGPVRGVARGMPPSRTMSMPANPFSAVPPGATAQRPAAVYGIQVGPAPAVGNGKAFAGYHPSSPISPYMSLYAPTTLGVDNYNAYVRPQLEQQALNRQVATAVRGLELERDLPDTTPRTLEQVPRLYPVGPGVSGASYMSFQRYYPGYPGNASYTPSYPQSSPSGSQYTPHYPGSR